MGAIAAADATRTFNPVTGLTTASGDNGTVIFKVLTDVTGVDQTTAVAAQSLAVDVK
ncbi:hypothetical protein D3C71_2247650 [compost metagenome]